jgi:hypothetical protein
VTLFATFLASVRFLTAIKLLVAKVVEPVQQGIADTGSDILSITVSTFSTGSSFEDEVTALLSA